MAYSISCRLEGYLKKAYGYIPLTYLDTTVLISSNVPALMARHALPELVSVFMNKIIAVDLEKAIARRRLLSFSQIDSFAQSRYHFPIDTTNTLAKGVYITADEFRNNTPSIPNYEMGKDPSGNIELRTPEPDGWFVPLYAPLGVTGFVMAGLTAIEEPVMRKLKVYRLDLESGTVTR